MNNQDATQIKQSNFSKENLRLVALVLLSIIVIAIINLAVNDPNSYYSGTLFYTLLILLFIFAIFSYIIQSFDSNSKQYIYIFIAIVIAIIIVITVILKSGIVNLLSNDYFLNGILFCIILFALAIFYFIFLEKIVNKPGWISFFIKFIFYIPCVFSDGIKYLLQDYYSTKSYIFYLLFIEFIFILMYFYFYPRLQNSVYDNGIILLKEPSQLNKEKRIDVELYRSFGNKKPLPNEKITIKSPIRQTFSLSMWIYLNNQAFSQHSYNKDTPIFAYVDNIGNPHPKIVYNQKLDKYIFYLSPTTKHSFEIPHQKWNNIVLNYRDLYVDIFINGILEISIQLKEIPVFTNTDKIVIGEDGINERSGLYGSICNIVYYKNIMTKGQIIDNYNLLHIRNPPIN